MDYGQTILPGESGGIPQDDTMMQLELKRRLALADSLKNAQMPEGQMVSGHYVAPSWTQYLANAVGKYQGGKQEQEAMKQYGQFQQAKQAKLADLLAGKEVQAPVDYNEAGNMPGMTQTTRQPYNQQEFMAKAVGAMPELAPQLIQNQIAQYGKEETPISLGEGGILVNRKGETIAQNPKAMAPKPQYSNVQKDEQTGKFFGLNVNTNQVEEIKGATATPKPMAAPVERKRMKGLTEVQEVMIAPPSAQYPEGQWKQVGQGPRFAPEKPQSDVARENLIFNKTRGLREDFAQLPETKSWNVIQPILVSVREAAKDNTGGSDLNLIYGMGKIMDPSSVVREGELQMAGNTGSLGQRLQGYYKSVTNGGKLPPAVKQDLLNQIESRAKPQQMLYENTKKKYTEIAKRNNLNPEDLFVEGITAPATSSARSAADAILGH